MNKKRVLHTVRKYYRQLDNTRKLMMPACEAENIHRFRVCYKKLKAFLHLLSTRWPGSKLAISGKLKRAYRLSGTIRELQLQQLRFPAAGEKGPELEYRKMLERSIDKPRQALSKLLSRELLAKSGKKNLKAIRGRFRLKDYRKFSEKKWNHISGIVMSESFSDTNLHQIRKELKELSYAGVPFRNKHHNVGGPPKLLSPSYKELSEKLGDFQDQCNAIRLLEPDAFPYCSIQEKKWLAQERKIWLHKKAAMKSSLVKELKIIWV